ncbi:1478d661-a025-4ccd-8bc5-a3f9bd957fc4 [Thermothielavioides terrestris]|uniref:Alpha-glucosidase n=1 Tax=Thermothielavioides terrestris TaxID=2587410 RepID=A0A3S4CZQ1_9PEZI|nr:1478d661-a025-4ccd-8bc5-a3f9bd957fc4 [Thermothielavioides terrestris]
MPQRAWWKEAAVYQIYPASFCDLNGDGIGDIPGILSKLDYLESLGVDVVWLCPVYESPQVDMGYDISDYRAIHAPYGTVQDVDQLIAALHKRGMKLVMDLVVNHTSDQHAWFKESRSSLDNPKRDWYIWRKPRWDAEGNRQPPNNWASVFGGSAWSFDEETGEYYLHLFCKEQPDLNWENPEVAQAVHDVMTFWLDKGVDGFRMDVINFISKTPGLPDAPVTIPDQQFQPAELHYADGPRLHEFLRGLRGILDKYNAFAVGEMPGVKEEAEVLKSVAEDRKELNMIFQFDIICLDNGRNNKFFPKEWSLPKLKAIVHKWQTCMFDNGGWNALFLENHDQSRSVSRFTPHRPENRNAAAKMLATFMGLQAGTLFVYQGQELGMANLPKDWGIDEYKDVETQNLYRLALEQHRGDPDGAEKVMEQVRLKARDHGRSPMQWNTQKHGGFTTGTPWMRVNEDYLHCNAEQQQRDPSSVFAYWQRLLWLRKQHADIFVYGSFELLAADDPAVVCYRRVHASAGAATVVLNFTDGEYAWEAPPGVVKAWEGARRILANYAEPGEIRKHSAAVVCLRPFEAVVLLEERKMC